ncbi:MAG: hypothetical protein CME06_11910 [Gemmatimonadetes bacterium]|nr:hypothetical protein [Gemmatimonadota bacterium]
MEERAPYQPGALLKLSAPLVVSFWMRSAFTFVDTIYASTLGDEAIAAIGLSVPLEFVFIAVWVGLSNGLTATLGEAFGARDDARVDRLLGAARAMVFVMMPAFVLLGVAVWFVAPGFALDPVVARHFAVYATVLVAGTGLTGFWSVLPDSLIKAHYDTRATMIAGVVSNIVNLVLNTVFLFVLEWGVFGIALSTVIGRLGGLSYALWRASVLEGERKRTWATGRPGAPEGRSAATRSGARRNAGSAILALALPASLSFGLMAAESGIVNRILAGLDYATAGIAAFAIYHRVALFAGMPMIAVSAAALPFFARAFGEGDLRAIRRGFAEVARASLVYVLLVVGPVSYFSAGWIARALADSPDTITFAIFALRAVPFAALATLPFVLCRPVFDGMQRGAPGAVMAVVRFAILTFPCAFGGAYAARAVGRPPFEGLVAGLIVAGLTASGVFLIWTYKALGHYPAKTTRPIS